MVQATIRGIRVASICLFAYWLLLFVATHIPRAPMPNFRHSDKVLHLCAFSILGFLLCWAIHSTIARNLGVWVAIVIAMIYAAIDEITQAPFGRTPDIQDWLTDCCGILIGALCFSIFQRLITSRDPQSA